jgi:trigger factor
VEVAVDTSGPCNARISVTIPAEEFEAEVTRALQRVGKHVRLKGFRPGKAPRAIIEKAHGEEVRRQAVQDLLGQAFRQAVEEHELKPAAHPRVRPEELVPLHGQALETVFDVPLRPEIVLGDYKGLAVESQPLDVEDAEVDAAIEDVKRQRSHPEPAEDAGLPADGLVLAKVELCFEGEVVLAREGLRLGTETPLPGSDPEAFAKALLGAKDGDVVEVPVIFPETFEHEPARGRAGNGRITVDQAFRIVPPTEAELFALFEVEDEAGLRETVRTRIREVKEQQEHGRVESALLELVLESHPLELPSTLVEDQVRDRKAELEKQLESQGVTGEAAASQIAGEEAEIRVSAERSLRGLFLIEAIAQKEGLGVTEEDMTTELTSIAQRNGATFEQVREYYGKRRLFDQLGLELLERKVRAFLRENSASGAAGSS